MNKAELIEVVAARIDTSKKDASEAVQAVVEAIQEAVAKGQKVSISGFGVFEKAERAARTYRAPSTGEAIRKVATAVPRFRPGGDFKASVSGQGQVEAEEGATPAKKAPAKKAPAKRAPVKKAPAAKKAPAKKAPAKKAPAATAESAAEPAQAPTPAPEAPTPSPEA